jgi:hypothetical protein
MRGGGLTIGLYFLCDLTLAALDCSSERCPIRKSSSKGYSRSARPPRTSQATAGTKREKNWGLEKRIRVKR